MRTRLITGIALACLCATVLAADEKPPTARRGPRSHIQPVSEIAAQSAAPWAGLVTARAPAVLREQLELKHGTGLIVEEVAAGSAAERAGLRQHDVLVALDGQLLVLPEQLTTLLEEWGDDEPLTCRLLRGGKPTEVTLRPRAAASVAQSSDSGVASKAAPPSITATPASPSPAESAALKPTASVLAMLPKKAAVKAPTATATERPAAGKPEPTTLTSTVIQLEDGSLLQRDADYSLKLSAGAEAMLTVKNARGRIVFNNRIATPEQRSLIPPEVLARVEGLERLQARRRLLAQPVVTEQSGSQLQPERIGSLGIEPVKVR
jgi:membrane-associated protease RseP (regulator of RpoE activity)